MTVKIVSDGTPQGTQVLNDGVPLAGVTKIELTMTVKGVKAYIMVQDPEVIIDGMMQAHVIELQGDKVAPAVPEHRKPPEDPGGVA
jgi:hypothetical protein